MPPGTSALAKRHMFNIREKLLKAVFAELWAGLAILVVAAIVCLPATGAAGFGCLIAGSLSGILVSPLFARLLRSGVEGKLQDARKGLSEARKTIDEQEADLTRIKNQLHALNVENRSLKMSSIEVSDISPILKLMLLQWKWKVWEPRQIDMGDGLTYHGLRTIALTANLGVDFEQLKCIETDVSIDVYGFKRARLFEDIGKRQWLYKEVWEKNRVFPGFTAYLDHDRLHRYTEAHDEELDNRINLSGPHDCDTIDEVLKEACRRLIRLAFKRTQKPINFLAGDAPMTAIPLADRLVAAPEPAE
jgi:hypothetical protein